jgi:hypothetical protein
VRLLRGLYRGMRWIEDRAHRSEAIALLVDGETTPELAALVYDLNLADDGLAAGARISAAGFRNVLELRNEFGGFETPQDLDFLASPESGLYDLRYYRRALHARAALRALPAAPAAGARTGQPCRGSVSSFSTRFCEYWPSLRNTTPIPDGLLSTRTTSPSPSMVSTLSMTTVNLRFTIEPT